jgi:hypothetical protein
VWALRCTVHARQKDENKGRNPVKCSAMKKASRLPTDAREKHAVKDGPHNLRMPTTYELYIRTIVIILLLFYEAANEVKAAANVPWKP